MTLKLDDKGAWVAQLVKRPTLDLDSGHDLMVHEFEPRVRLCAERGLLEIPSPISLCPSPKHACSLTLSQNK